MGGQNFMQAMAAILGARRIHDGERAPRPLWELGWGVRAQPFKAPSAFVLIKWPQNATHVLVQHYAILRR